MTTSFAKETDLCAAFITAVPDGWTAYPETGGFDILLVRKADGIQIGVEAKLRLNAKVVLQAAEETSPFSATYPGPDFRAVLVPDGGGFELAAVCRRLGVTVLKMRHGEAVQHYRSRFYPELPTGKGWNDDEWYENCPSERLAVPEWVPDVSAGASAPVALTAWKIGAIKLVITLSKRGYLTRQDFTHFRVSMSRWTQSRWLVRDGQGGWIAGDRIPDFRAQHPVNFGQIEAEYEKWKSPAKATQPGLFAA